MADNVTLPGTSAVIASKDIGGVEHQKVLISDGTTPAQTLGVDSSGRATVNVNGTVPVSMAAAPTGAALDASLATINTSVGAGNTALGTLHTDLGTLNTSVGAGNTSSAATAAGMGAPADAAASADTGTFSLIAILKRVVAKLTSLIGLFPGALGAGGGLKVDGSGTALPVSGTVAISGTVAVSTAPATSGGLSVAHSISLLNTGLVVKASAGQLYGYYFYNNSAATRFIKICVKATAGVPGTDVPLMVLPLAAGAAANLLTGNGIQFATGISVIGTQLVADSDNTAPAANDLIVALFYK